VAKAQPVEIGEIKFPRKGDALKYLQSMLNSYRFEERVSDDDQTFLLNALNHHPDGKEKLGVGLDYFFVRRADYGTKCFWIKRLDGSVERFSYKHCVP